MPSWLAGRLGNPARRLFEELGRVRQLRRGVLSARFRGALLGCLLAVLSGGLGALAAQGAAPPLCDTGAFLLRGDYAGARLGNCQVIDASQVEIEIHPEDSGPINPSPWYGFHVQASLPDAGELRVRLRYGKYRHRYAPKISLDGAAWRRLPDAEVEVSDDGSVLMRLRPGRQGLHLSAKENLNLAFYEAWREKIEPRAPGGEWTEIGQSLEGRPIHALLVNPQAPSYLLLLGRQHPPEVPGALALIHFMERLLEIGGPALFQARGLAVAPLLNPDGVRHGHWRHNLGGAGLNRDWGPFRQPETRAVKQLVDRLDGLGSRPWAVLDFHSTHRSLFYIQDDESPTRPPNFTARWLSAAEARGELYEFAREPRPLSELATAKNYFYARFGVPSITWEVGDEEDRQAIAKSAAAFADALVEMLAEPPKPRP